MLRIVLLRLQAAEDVERVLATVHLLELLDAVYLMTDAALQAVHHPHANVVAMAPTNVDGVGVCLDSFKRSFGQRVELGSLGWQLRKRHATISTMLLGTLVISV
jgi:hypothetical protein